MRKLVVIFLVGVINLSGIGSAQAENYALDIEGGAFPFCDNHLKPLFL
jgi:hypothetical protein